MAQITYENKVKINDSSLPAVNKVRDVDMNEIKDVVNTNYSEQQTIQNQLEDSITYSEQEVIVGKWIDGRPMYQLTIFIKNLSAVTSYALNNLTSYCPNFDIDAFLIINAQYKRNGYQQWWNISDRLINAQSAPGTIELNNFNSYGASEIRLIVEYAKTTD